MSDTTHDNRWRRGHEAARDLHHALLHLGIPGTELVALTARPDATGAPRVHIPSLSPESVERITTALGPYLGPAWTRRRDEAPTAPRGAA